MSLTNKVSSAHKRDAASSVSESSPVTTTIQRTIAKLDALQPKLDAARYKAEAGISRRGYVNHSHFGTKWVEEGEEGLMSDGVSVDRGDGASHDFGNVSDVTSDDERSDGKREGKSQVAEPSIDQDSLKWPAGEGWRPLS